MLYSIKKELMRRIGLGEFCVKEPIIQLIRCFDQLHPHERMYLDENRKYIIVEPNQISPRTSINRDGDLLIIIKEIIFSIFSQTKDIESVYHVFNDVYDDLCYDILFKKIIIPKKVRNLLELFASPIYSADAYVQKKIISKYLEKTEKKRVG
jgi:hypothetical protein